MSTTKCERFATARIELACRVATDPVTSMRPPMLKD